MKRYDPAVARSIDELAVLRKNMHVMAERAERHRQIILKAGGGQSRHWVAAIRRVRGIEHRFVRAHRQVVLKRINP